MGAPAPVIAVSGGGAMQPELLLGSAQALGADLILSKPFNVERLLRGIERLVAMHAVTPNAGS